MARWLTSPWPVAFLLGCVAAIPRLARPDIAEYKLDEATVVLNARGILQDHVFPLHGQASSVPGLYHSPILYYLVAPFLALQADPRAAILGIGLLNALAVGLSYVVVARSFNRRIALTSTLLFASGSWALIFSRKIWSIDFLAPCAVVALWGILRAADSRTRAAGLGRSWLALAIMVALNYSSWPLAAVVGLAQACLPRSRRGAALVWSALGLSALVVPLVALAPNLIVVLGHLTAQGAPGATFDLQPLDFVVQLASPTGFYVLAGPSPAFAREASALGQIELPMRLLLFLGAALAAWRMMAPLTPRPAARLRLTPEAIVLLWWLTPAVLSLYRPAPVYIHHFADTFPAQFILIGLGADGMARLAGAALARIRPLAGGRAIISLATGPSLAAGAAAVQLIAFSLYLPYIEAHPLGTFFGVPLSDDLRAVQSARAASPVRPILALGSTGDTVGIDESPTVLSSLVDPSTFQFADSDRTLTFPASAGAAYLFRRAPGDDLDAALAPWRAPGGPLPAASLDVGPDYQVTVGHGLGNWLPPDWHHLEAPLEDDSLVVGYSAPRQLQPGKASEVDVAWRVGQPAADPQQQSVFAHVVDDGGNSPTGQDLAPMPSSAWTSDETMVNRFTITPPDDLAPGRYWIDFGRYLRPEIQPVRVIVDGKPGPSSVKLGPLAVAPRPHPVSGLTPVNANYAGQIALTGWKAKPRGSNLDVVLLWRADQAPDKAYTVFVHLIGAGGGVVSRNDSQPRSGKFPTSTWDPKDQIPDRHLLPIQNVKAGTYRLQIGLYASDGQRLSVGKGDSVTVGPIAVTRSATSVPTRAATPQPPKPRPHSPPTTPVSSRAPHRTTPTPRTTATAVRRAAPAH
ncbi:MAG: hypothetical protein ACRDIY_23705 [Chloroflexota bacterium]